MRNPISELKKQLEKMNRTQLANFIDENSVVIEGDFEKLTKKQIIRKAIDFIEYRKLYSDYYE